MDQPTSPTSQSRRKMLPVVDRMPADLDLDAELRSFEAEERRRLGLDAPVEHWVEDMVDLGFKKSERAKTTLLVGGLTMAQDYFVEGALRGVGYQVIALDTPTTEAFQAGKEFGNRGQCNPTYFTVGNLVQYLITLRDKHGMTAQEIVDRYVFFTAGACGPCRFGMYVTEYRKALRDAGFDGFRVMLFQQTGGLQQATGDDVGLDLNPRFFWQIVKALIAGDALNAIGYRLRPYEKEKGATDRALDRAKKTLYHALENQKNVLWALHKCRAYFAAVELDKTLAKPKVSIIGEFWAMTTEGDGNYQLQRFLEQEGAEVDIQLLSAWLLYSLWEVRNDAKERANLREMDAASYGLGGKGAMAVFEKLAISRGGDFAVRALFQTFAHAIGLYGYKLPDMDAIAAVSREYYNNDLRGGEGHMEVGKLILNVVHQKAHMTLSVKPFGCMPSAGVSDGVQTAITEKFPGTIFCPVETSGDGRVNFYSRVQMYLFKAKQAALAEYERALEEHGVTKEQVESFLQTSRRFRSPLFKASHVYAGSSADVVAAVAPYITKTRGERLRAGFVKAFEGSKVAARKTPHVVVDLFQTAVKEAPTVAARVKEDVTLVLEFAQQRKSKKARPSQVSTLDAAAEE